MSTTPGGVSRRPLHAHIVPALVVLGVAGVLLAAAGVAFALAAQATSGAGAVLAVVTAAVVTALALLASATTTVLAVVLDRVTRRAPRAVRLAAPVVVPVAGLLLAVLVDGDSSFSDVGVPLLVVGVLLCLHWAVLHARSGRQPHRS